MNSVRSTWVMSCISRPANAIGMAPRPIRRWGISRSHSLAVKPHTVNVENRTVADIVAADDRGDQERESVAERLALDSHSQLGPIRRANQGVFEIMGRDTAGDAASTDDQASIEKKVRLVAA